MLLIVSFACFKKFYPFFSFPNFFFFFFFFHFELQRAVLVKTLDCFWRDHLINMNRLSSAVTYMHLLIWISLNFLYTTAYINFLSGEYKEFWAQESS